MFDSDDFTSYHQELLDGRYDCVDRIVLNGYFPLGQTGGGFRSWWRELSGSEPRLIRIICSVWLVISADVCTPLPN